jgi:betaine reductase
MGYAVINRISYILAHTPDILIQHGAVQAATRKLNPQDAYLQNITDFLRPYDEVVSYPANQCYIGNITPDELDTIELPWYKRTEKAERLGKFGDIIRQEEFYALLQHVDVFQLVSLTPEFVEAFQGTTDDHPILGKLNLLKEAFTESAQNMQAQIDKHQAEPLMLNGELVGCVKQAHDEDENLSAHIMLENLCAKASGAIAAQNLELQGVDLQSIDYIIECSEEACGDVNQRGGGNFAKAIGEVIGCTNATGSDLRGFCAAPAHAFTTAAALVKAGVFKNVLVVAGGAVAKLGMNGKDHVAKEMPILEDVLAGFACLVSENDGVNPIINTDVIGRHTIGTGSSPQAVITSLIHKPLADNGRNMTQIDKYSVEMHNPEITKPAGAGNVPESNYKMIAALAVKEGLIERKELPAFVAKHGMVGWAPTQGHIPSGVPFVGFGRDMILNGEIENFMAVGKGSLFLGRMTNLFDGLSFVVEKNPGLETDSGFNEDRAKQLIAQAMKNVAETMLELDESESK